MNALINWMNSTLGRAARVVLGLALIYVGLAVVGGAAGLIVALIGLAPIAMGVWGRCLLEAVAPQAKRA